ncbi:MAG: tRNA pseudouridine(55) synthase TruB [Nitrospiraceae bacterium]|nr:tRNA pseudouridine(55) synthase TruB [Nitrospiraceae bacterium]
MDLIINLNKPSGITSQQAVARVKRMLRVKKAGHTGTLDPLATGVLLICLNEATKVSRFFLDMDKKYRARMKLGERTDTYDAEGRITATSDASALREGEILEAVLSFRGAIDQTPPMYSAVKMNGKVLYELARKGIEVERQSRSVTIYDIAVADIHIPYVDLIVACSKGTYIRSLCDDIGQKLGVGAHLTALERVAVGSISVRDSLRFEDLGERELVPDGGSILSIDGALGHMPELCLDGRESLKVRYGQRIPMREQGHYAEGDAMKLKGPGGELIGIGSICSGMIIVERNLNL